MQGVEFSVKSIKISCSHPPNPLLFFFFFPPLKHLSGLLHGRYVVWKLWERGARSARDAVFVQHSSECPGELCWAIEERDRDGKRLPTRSGAHTVLAGQQSSKICCMSVADTNPVLFALPRASLEGYRS